MNDIEIIFGLLWFYTYCILPLMIISVFFSFSSSLSSVDYEKTPRNFKLFFNMIKNNFIYWSYLIYYYVSITIEQLKASTDDDKLISRAKKYALLTHHGVRQRYDHKYPYYYHLKMVSNNALRFSACLTQDQFVTAYIICLFHDLIEDCRLTYADVKHKWGSEIADGVYVCTDLRGRNRKERHGPQFIKELKESFLGTYGKLCDVFANMEMGLKTGSSMLDMYRKDYPYTKRDLYRPEFEMIFQTFEAELITKGA